MKLFRFSSLAVMVATAYTLLAADQYKYKFSETTPLSQGRWVKVAIDKTGVYEITDAELRAMGFSNPGDVKVFGNGGKMRDLDFSTYGGTRIYNDNLEQVSQYRKNNKIYFYAQGTEVAQFKYLYPSTQRYERLSKNIYSDVAYYLLTDASNVTKKTVQDVAMGDYTRVHEFSSGVDYISHELDQVPNVTGAGQCYYGESLIENAELTFNEKLAYSVPGYIYVESQMVYAAGQGGTMVLDVNNVNVTSTLTNNGKDGYQKQSTGGAKVEDDGNVTLKFKLTPDGIGDARLDYWVLSYPKCMPEYDADLVQEHASFFKQSSNDQAGAAVMPRGTLVWDVSDILNPQRLPVQNNKTYWTNPNLMHRIVAFNPDKEQLKLLPGYTEVPNQNLRAMRDQNLDMIIYTVPEMRQYAERIAELHRQHDGMNVAVIDPELCYNEFTAAMPDPIALRAFNKYIYQTGNKRLANVLMVGPYTSDYRNIAGRPNPPYSFISFQTPSVMAMTDHVSPVSDYYAYMTDNFPSTSQLYSATVEIGFGSLPITSAKQGEIAVAKIKEQLEKKDFSWTVNETLSIGCAGDQNEHIDMASTNAKNIDSSATTVAKTKLNNSMQWLERSGGTQATGLTSKLINDGKLYSVYYGHSGMSGLGNFYGTQNFMQLKNPDLGVFLFASCDTSLPDQNQTGIAQACVTDAERGMFASITASRTVFSNHNLTFGNFLIQGMFYAPTNGSYNNMKPRTTSPTIGQVYAVGKTQTKNNSENCYSLIGDPALKFHIPLANISLEVPERKYAAGEVVEVKGTVMTPDGQHDTAYDGYVTLKLNAPIETYSERYASIADGWKTLKLNFGDNRLAAVRGEVRGGKFTLKLPIPQSASVYYAHPDSVSTGLQLFAGAFSPAVDRATAGVVNLQLIAMDAEPEAGGVTDTQAPDAQLVYDPALRALRATASDNIGLVAGIGAQAGLRVKIDGKEITQAPESAVGSGVTAYEAVISAFDLAEGSHTAEFSCVDMAGNSTAPTTYQFTVKTPGQVALTAADAVAVDALELTLADSGVTGLTLRVADRSGRIVKEEAVEAGAFSVDVSTLTKGVYTAAVLKDSAEGATIHSNTVTFAKID